MQISSKSSTAKSTTHTKSATTTKSAATTKSNVQTAAKAAKPAAPKDTFTASNEGGKANSAVPNFGSWAMAPAPSPAIAPGKSVPSDPAPRVAPAPVAKALPEPSAPMPASAPSPTASVPPLPGKEVPASPAPKTPTDKSAAKVLDDTSWATAQVRHAADFANQTGSALQNETLINKSASALKPLNPAAGLLGGAALAGASYDSFKKGNYTEGALQGGLSGSLLTAGGAGLVKGGELLAKGAGRAAPALGGALQAYDGIKTGDKWDMASGGAKLAGAAMIATGFGAPVGSALIIGSYMADLGRWGYQKMTQ